MSGVNGVAIVGSGPNGLSAAVTLARAGIPVTIFEAANAPGGGTRTAETVQAGVLHDVCSAIHPLAYASEFFQKFELSKRIRFVAPEVSYAHPLAEASGTRVLLAYRDLERTASELGRDGASYTRYYRPLLQRLSEIIDFSLGGSMARVPKNLSATLLTLARIAEQGTLTWNTRFREKLAPALITGVAAHSVARMPSLAASGVGLLLGVLGHASGWPVPIGGSRAISDALLADIVSNGGQIKLNHPIEDVRELEEFQVKIFDTSARELLRITGETLPVRYRRALARLRYGNAAAKVDLILDGAIPWQDPRAAESPTVHLGGTRAQIQAAEREVAHGRHPENPYVLLAQPTVFDPGRNPTGVHAVWSYTHVPSGSSRDVSEQVIKQIERFAPGVREKILNLKVTTALELGEYNRNYPGGDFSAGAVTLRQLLVRPTFASEPWRTPDPNIYLCSASVSPGPGVHGLTGWYAARTVLHNNFHLPEPYLGVSADSVHPPTG